MTGVIIEWGNLDRGRPAQREVRVKTQGAVAVWLE